MKIAVYGASGYTGKLICAEVLRRDFGLVMVGRSIDRLRQAASELAPVVVDVRPAPVADTRALARAFADVDAVINCAGPFTLFGVPVVRAAIAAGCHYVDTTGEQLYIKRLFDEVGEEAERAGVTVVPAMGYDIVPGDLMAHVTGREVEPVRQVRIGYSTTGFDMTRGTMRSVLEMFQGDDVRFAGGEWRPAGLRVGRKPMLLPDSPKPARMLKFPGGEAVTVPRHVGARDVEVVMDARSLVPGRLLGALAPIMGPPLALALRTPLRRTLSKAVARLPEGPTPERRAQSAFAVVGEAVGLDGRRARGVLHGRDIYGCTARISVEGVSRLVSAGAKPGVLAPAQAFDPDDFLGFLGTLGFRWSVTRLEPGARGQPLGGTSGSSAR